MSEDRMQPYSVEAEQSVLGAIMMEPDAIYKVMSILKGDDFFIERHRWIWEAAVALVERHQPLDYIALLSEIERHRQIDDLGGSLYVTSLINLVPTAAHIENYARLVERTSLLRKLIAAAGEIAGEAYRAEGDITDIITKAEQAIFAISQRKLQKDLLPITHYLGPVTESIEYLQTHRGEFIGVPSHFASLDKMLGGLQPKDLIIIAGRPSIGKTAFALNIVQNVSLHLPRKTVALFSLEMGGEQMVLRLIANLSGIDGQRLRLGEITDEEHERMIEVVGRLSEAPIYIDDSAGATPNEISSKARRLAMERGLDLVVIDYLQLMHSGSRSENRVQEIASISRALKALARELNVPVIALSQLSRAVESRPDKHPQLSDLRESGSIEQDADVVMFLYRDDAYNQTTEKPNIAEVIIAKHRNGPTGTVELYFNRAQSRFANLEYYKEEGY